MTRPCWGFELQLGQVCCFTWVFPPVLSCTALLERAVLAAKDLKDAPKILLTPNAISSCSQVREKTRLLHQYDREFCPNTVHFCIVAYLISINAVVMFYRIDFCHREGHSETHYSHRECFDCRVLEDVQVGSNWRLVPEMFRSALLTSDSVFLQHYTQSLICTLLQITDT